MIAGFNAGMGLSRFKHHAINHNEKGSTRSHGFNAFSVENSGTFQGFRHRVAHFACRPADQPGKVMAVVVKRIA